MRFNLDTKREKLIEEQHPPLEELNVLVSYRIEHEGMNHADQVFLEDNPRMNPSEELYHDAMVKLAKVLLENTNIQQIMKVFFEDTIMARDIFPKMGFNCLDISQHAFVHNVLTLNFQGLKKRPKILAIISRAEFLKRFGKNSEQK